MARIITAVACMGLVALAAGIPATRALAPPTRSPQTAALNPAVHCQNDALHGVAFTWCTKRGPHPDPNRILYFFHARSGTGEALFNADGYERLRETWADVHGAGEPVVITISFGPQATLTNLPSAYVEGAPKLLPLFVDEVMPFIERQVVGPGFTGERYALGMSIGGFSVTEIVESHPDLFSKVALLCPAFMPMSPYAQADEQQRLVASTRARPSQVTRALEHFYNDFATPGAWQEQEPLTVARERSIAFPKLFVLYNTADDYGFDDGAKRFIAAARAQGASVDEESNAGPHCDSDWYSEQRLAEFLL